MTDHMTDHETLLNDLQPGKMIRLTGGGTILRQQDGSLLYSHDDHEREVSKQDALTILTDHDVVIFRYWLDDILALFPYLVGDPDPSTCMSYQHVGQHGAAAFNAMLDDSRPATPEEYADLQTELESMEYELAIVEDIHRNKTYVSRQRQLRELSV